MRLSQRPRPSRTFGQCAAEALSADSVGFQCTAEALSADSVGFQIPSTTTTPENSRGSRYTSRGCRARSAEPITATAISSDLALSGIHPGVVVDSAGATVRRNRKQPWWRAIVHSCPDRARPAAAGDASHDPSMIHVIERQVVVPHANATENSPISAALSNGSAVIETSSLDAALCGRRWPRRRRQGSPDAGHALDPTAPRPIVAATPLGFPCGSPPGRSSERLERARPGSLGRAVEAQALPGTAGSGTRRPQITFPPPEEPTGGFCCPEATLPVHRQLIPGRRGPRWGWRRPSGRRRCPRTGRST